MLEMPIGARCFFGRKLVDTGRLSGKEPGGKMLHPMCTREGVESVVPVLCIWSTTLRGCDGRG